MNKNEWLLKSLSNDMEYVCMHNRLFGFPTQIYGSVCPHMEENANHLNYGLLKNARSVHWQLGTSRYWKMRISQESTTKYLHVFWYQKLKMETSLVMIYIYMYTYYHIGIFPIKGDFPNKKDVVLLLLRPFGLQWTCNCGTSVFRWPDVLWVASLSDGKGNYFIWHENKHLRNNIYTYIYIWKNLSLPWILVVFGYIYYKILCLLYINTAKHCFCYDSFAAQSTVSGNLYIDMCSGDLRWFRGGVSTLVGSGKATDQLPLPRHMLTEKNPGFIWRTFNFFWLQFFPLESCAFCFRWFSGEIHQNDDVALKGKSPIGIPRSRAFQLSDTHISRWINLLRKLNGFLHSPNQSSPIKPSPVYPSLTFQIFDEFEFEAWRDLTFFGLLSWLSINKTSPPLWQDPSSPREAGLGSHCLDIHAIQGPFQWRFTTHGRKFS